MPSVPPVSDDNNEDSVKLPDNPVDSVELPGNSEAKPGTSASKEVPAKKLQSSMDSTKEVETHSRVEPGTLPSRADPGAGDETQKHLRVVLPTPTRAKPAPQNSATDFSMAEPGPVERASAKLVAIARGAHLATPFRPLPRPTSEAELYARRLRRRKTLRYLTRKHTRQVQVDKSRSTRRIWVAIASVLLTLLIIFLSLSGAGGFVTYQFFTQTQAKYEGRVTTLRDILPRDNLKIYDSNNIMLAQMTNMGTHTTVNLEQVSVYLQRATIATEDKNFWTNQGVDVLRIIQAAIDDLTHGHVVEGGSTITQQLIKNLIVGNETSILRKLEEVVLTPQLNSHYSKHDILEMYLNAIYYGNNANGIDAAAKSYFGLEDKPGKPAASQLDIAQSATLAGIPSSPTAYNPLLHPKAGLARFRTVLSLMLSQGYITRAEELNAIKEQQSPHFFKPQKSLPNRAPHFVNFVERQLEQQYHLTPDQLAVSGMSVYTTLNINLQDKIQKIAQQHVAELQSAGHNLTNSAEVMIDYHTGAVISLLGSIDYYNKSIDGQFDVATQGYRQPGSSFKPYVYATAFKQGFSPGQAIADVPTSFPDPGADPPDYAPQNYDLRFHGHMTLRCALQNSLNVPAVKTLAHVGIGAALKTAQNMGISTYTGVPGLSMVLGGLSIKLIDHVSGIGTFANGGVHMPYYTVNKIYMNNDMSKPFFVHPKARGKRVLSPQVSYMMTDVLKDNPDRIPDFGVCNPLQLYSNPLDTCYSGDPGSIRPAAAKTGTTNDFRDNWTVGYTTDYVMGVWSGNDDNTPMVDVNGIQGAAPIWHDSMLVAEEGKPIRDFNNPGGLTQQTVTYPDGVTSTDWYLPGTGPSSASQQSTFMGSQMPTTPLPSKPHPPKNAAPYCPSYSFSGDGSYGSVW